MPTFLKLLLKGYWSQKNRKKDIFFLELKGEEKKNRCLISVGISNSLLYRLDMAKTNGKFSFQRNSGAASVLLKHENLQPQGFSSSCRQGQEEERPWEQDLIRVRLTP